MTCAVFRKALADGIIKSIRPSMPKTQKRPKRATVVKKRKEFVGKR